MFKSCRQTAVHETIYSLMLTPTINETFKYEKVKQQQAYSFVNVILSFFFFFTKRNISECGKLLNRKKLKSETSSKLSHAPGQEINLK